MVLSRKMMFNPIQRHQKSIPSGILRLNCGSLWSAWQGETSNLFLSCGICSCMYLLSVLSSRNSFNAPDAVYVLLYALLELYSLYGSFICNLCETV